MARFAWEDPQTEGRGLYWTDGWDGYAPSRQRLLATVAERRVGGVVVLGGDVHANYVADLKADFDDDKSAVLATEFCGTSISSLGLDQARLDAALPFNPHIRHARADRRGYVRFKLEPTQLLAEMRVLDDGRDPASAISTAQRYAVAADRPGAQAL
jgi:alkaline phosphatase D